MEMKKHVEELHRLRASTLDAARPQAVEKQKALGKLTARKRLELLCDPGTFLEFGQLAEAPNIPDKETPADGMIIGIGEVNGRRVAMLIYDFTVLGASQGDINHAKADHLHLIALEQAIPIVYLLEGGGARAQDLRAYSYHIPDMWYQQVRLSGWVPMAAGVMGPSYAGQANLAGMSDFVVMNEKTSSMGVAGTHLVRASLSQDITHFELAGAKMHDEMTGVSDMLVDNDEDCIAKIKDFLSFFPDNAGEMPQNIPCDDPIDRREEKLLGIVPDSDKRGYDMYQVIEAIVDHGKIFDIKPNWARNMITCLVRLGGRPVGVVANQPMFMAGVIDSHAAEKFSHFVEMCDAFNIPILLLVDVPGFMMGPEHERLGVVRRAQKTIYSLFNCTVPLLSVVIRKSFGHGGYVMGTRGFHPNFLVGWPSAQMGGMGLGGAVEIMYRRRIAESDEPENLRAELYEELLNTMTAIPTAKAYGFDDVIDPRDTRSVLIQALKHIRRREPSMPPKKHGIAPF